MPEPWMCPLPRDEECPHAQERDYLLEEIEKLRDELQDYKEFMEGASRTHGIANLERHKERLEMLEKLNVILDPKHRDATIDKQTKRMIHKNGGL